MVMMGVDGLAFTGAFRADALYHIVYSLRTETVRQLYNRNRYILQAECAVAGFAVEMDVTVIVNIACGMTELISDPITAVINLMQKMVLIEESQGAEYAGLVNGVYLVLQLSHSYWPMTIRQRLKYQQPVGRGLDSVFLQQLFHQSTRQASSSFFM